MRIRHTSLRTPVNAIIIASIVAVSSLAWFITAKLVAAADPEITGGSSIAGVTDEFIAVEGIEITGDVTGITVVTASTTSGTLRFADTTGVTFNGATTGRNVSINGTKEALNNALESLQYRANTEGSATISVTLGRDDVVYYPGNGHLYEVVSVDDGISWDDAKQAAEARELLGAPGYLATISDQDENDYITARLTGDGWFGASDAAVEGEWRWVTGPEAGTLFWLGAGGGQLQPGQFANWASGEPNDSGSGEDCAQFYGSGSGWNDLPCSMTLGSYVVEYGDDDVLPAVPPQSTTVHITATTTTRTPAAVTLSSCEQFFDEYVNSTEHRYDDITLAQDLDCGGAEITPLFSDYEYDEEEGETYTIGFKGSFDGNGHTISNVTIVPTEDPWGNPGPSGLFSLTDPGVVIENLTLNEVTVKGYECIGGIVGRAQGLTLRNVHFNGSISPEDEDDAYVSYSGGLVGCLYNEDEETSTIEQSSAEVTFTSESGYSLGGLVGDAGVDGEDTSLSIENNTTQIANGSDAGTIGGAVGRLFAYDGTISVSDTAVNGEVRGYSKVGGLIGELYGSSAAIVIQDVHLTVPVYAYDHTAGGLLGAVASNGYDEDVLTIQNVSSTGDVSAYEYAGGLVGYFGGSNYQTNGVPVQRIEQSFATGDVTSRNGRYAGGLVAYTETSLINESFATGDVQANQRAAGGLVGYMYLATVTNSYARGNVTTNQHSAGGLVGAIDESSVVTNSYSTGNLSPEEGEESDMGGLIGVRYADDIDVTSSYWDTQTSGYATSVYGEGKTTAQMKNRTTYADWDFDIWGLTAGSNNGYPCLLWYEGCATDDDTDGIPSSEESAAPNGGDANNDGTPDAQQSNVASFVSPVTNRYVSLEVDPQCSIKSVQSITEGQNAALDAQYQYQTGLLDFSLDCAGQVGFTTYVKQYYYGLDSLSGLVARKYNPNTQQYWTITGNGLSLASQSIAGQSVAVLSYNVTDGGDLDIDGVANGLIADPVGLAVASSSPLPDTGLKSSLYVTIAAVLAGVGIVTLVFAARMVRSAHHRD